MAVFFSSVADASLKAAILPLVANEVRGLILVGPVLYGMYESGGNLMALWIGFCSLCGIALSIAAPLFLARRLQGRLIHAPNSARRVSWRVTESRRPLSPTGSRSL
jgi:hypothetical protein